jgi:hypothetical protein
LFSQSFLLVSVIPSFLSHSCGPPSFLSHSHGPPSFLSHSRSPLSLVVQPHLSAPSSSSLHRPRNARRDLRRPFPERAPPRSLASFFKPPRALCTLIPYLVAAQTLNRRPLAPPRSFSCSAADPPPHCTSAPANPRISFASPPGSFPSSSLMTPTRVAPELHRGSPPVNYSSPSIPCRRWYPDRLNPRSTSAGAPRADPW